MSPSSCSTPEPPPSYEPDDLVEAWLAMSEAHEDAHNVKRFARYAPELGWRSLLAVLELPDALTHCGKLAGALRMLIAQYGADFIDRIEHEAEVSSAFRLCLAEVHPDPTFPIPEALWARLSSAAGVPIGPMSRRMAELYAELPDLSMLTSWDPHPLAREDAPTLGDAELRAQAQAWVIYHQSFWAWEELNRVLSEEGWEAAWPLILRLVERASEACLAPIGAGILEDMLSQYGETILLVEREAAANPRFRYCLSHAWQADMPDAIWNRVVRARGEEPQRG